jgi:Adenylate and Guanylate cyclase catalytic domain
MGDLHEPQYDYLKRSYTIRTDDVATSNNTTKDSYTILLYPTTDMEESFLTSSPIIFALSIVGIFCFTAFVFAVYNKVIQRRQNKVMSALRVTSKVVLSLFPANVLDRLIKEAEANTDDNNATTTNRLKAAFASRTQKAKLQSFLDDDKGDESHVIFKSKPIADLYPNATVMYADIAGFTAWSSIREPSQVFTLLEALFRQYDTIAKRRRIFKVETIGDCYVAVAGVPHPRSDHAVAMSRFARDCIISMNVLSKKLEVELGPDTSGM